MKEAKRKVYTRITMQKEKVKMKKLAVLMMIAAMSMNLVACGGNKENNNASSESSVVEESQETSVESSIEESTEESGTESTEEVVPEDGMGEATMSEEMTGIRQAVVDALGENYWPQMAIPVEFLDGFGLTADMYEEFFGEMPMISTNVDTLIIIKAKDGQVEAVEGVLNAYRENLVNDTMQYPMNVGKIQASEVKTFGNFVCFVQLGADVMDAAEKGDEEVIKHCQAQNAIAIEALENAIG